MISNGHPGALDVSAESSPFVGSQNTGEYDEEEEEEEEAVSIYYIVMYYLIKDLVILLNDNFLYMKMYTCMFQKFRYWVDP